MRRLALTLAAAILAFGCGGHAAPAPVLNPARGETLVYRPPSGDPTPEDVRLWNSTPPANRIVLRPGDRFTFLGPGDEPGFFVVHPQDGGRDDLILPAAHFRRPTR
jgi:hypothetical protein